MTRKNTTAIIVAAGAGKRMNSPIKKQYIEIAGHPVLYYTIRAFEESRVDDIVIVTGADETEYVKKEIVEKYGFCKVSCVCAGGRERFDSVYEGIRQVKMKSDPTCEELREIKKKSECSRQIEMSNESSCVDAEGKAAGDKQRCSDYVLIHDGVRMLVTPELINRCIDAVYENGACVAAVPVKDTIKECGTIVSSGNIKQCETVAQSEDPVYEHGMKDILRPEQALAVEKTLDRSRLYLIQTPQCFELGLIDSAFEKMFGRPVTERPAVTDDAMVVEIFTDHKVMIVEGDYKNIKITTPDDLELAEFRLKQREQI